MFSYLLKRFIWFVPTLFLVTLFGFFLLQLSSENAINSYLSNPNVSKNSSLNIEQQKDYWKKELGFDLPVFYFSISPLSSNKNEWKYYVPSIKWYGSNNQYHYWFFGGKQSKGIIRGDFGTSYKTNEPVMFILKEKVGWSLFFSVASILLAYLISIPLGLKLAQKPNTRFYKWTHRFLFFIYTLPPFFIGILLLIIFANPNVLHWFPASGIKPLEDENTFNFMNSLPFLILPLIVYTYSSLAFITKLTETSINNELQFDYIRTAKAKGLSNNQIIYRHALKNGLLPLITVFSSVFPSIIGGSVIIENLFSIPGMGNETVKSIIAHDYPVVIAIVTISSIITLLAYLITDILYMFVDKRINLNN